MLWHGIHRYDSQSVHLLPHCTISPHLHVLSSLVPVSFPLPLPVSKDHEPWLTMRNRIRKLITRRLQVLPWQLSRSTPKSTT